MSLEIDMTNQECTESSLFPWVHDLEAMVAFQKCDVIIKADWFALGVPLHSFHKNVMVELNLPIRLPHAKFITSRF